MNEVLEKALAVAFSRRDLLRAAGVGTVGLLAGALLPAPSLARARAPQGRAAAAGALGKSDAAVDPLSFMQLPAWGDGAKFDQPQYYGTIQAGRRMFPKTYRTADIDGDGQDELIARGPHGIVVQRFDPVTGQWRALPNGPAWSDRTFFAESFAYATIQTADIDGDGRDELLAFNGFGIEAWKFHPGNDLSTSTWEQLPAGPESIFWISPDSYQTIQCADIDGDGRDELLIRDLFGLHVWKYTASRTWQAMPGLSSLSDVGGWNLPQYYQTIQCADIDGDGQYELLARGPGGVMAWKYAANTQTWNALATCENFADVHYWNLPQYYQTLQFADIDGDGREELLARGTSEFFVYKFNAAGQWQRMSDGPNWTDAAAWDHPEYYQTIQAADIDGDGRAELIARDGIALEAWKFDAATQLWNPMWGGPLWSDVNAPDGTEWVETQYYSTIQTARIKGDPRNPNNPPDSAGKAYAAVLGRSKYCIETWRYRPVTGGWTQTSPPLPNFAGGQLTAYNYISQNLGNGSVDLRQRYPKLIPYDIVEFQKRFPGGQSPLAPPPGVSSSDWTAVTTQIYNELTAVGSVNSLRDLTTSQLLVNITLDQGLLGTVNSSLKGSVQSVSSKGWTITVTLLEMFANAAWAVSALAGEELAPSLSAVTGLFAAGSIGLGLIPDPSASPTYGPNELTALKADLAKGFAAATTGNQEFARLAVQNWGLLQVQGALSGFDPSVPTTVTNSYEVYAYRTLARMYWVIAAMTYADFQTYISGVDAPFVWDDGNGHDYYIGNYDATFGPAENCPVIQMPVSTASGAMQRLFASTNPPGLNQPITDPLESQNGWSLSNGTIFPYPYTQGCTRPEAQPGGPTDRRPSPGEARLTVAPTLARDAAGGVTVAIVVKNEGGRALTNIELTGIELTAVRGGWRAHRSGTPDARRTRLAFGGSDTLYAVFPRASFPHLGSAGDAATLSIRGEYKGGTFGGSFEVTLPA